MLTNVPHNDSMDPRFVRWLLRRMPIGELGEYYHQYIMEQHEKKLTRSMELLHEASEVLFGPGSSQHIHIIVGAVDEEPITEAEIDLFKEELDKNGLKFLRKNRKKD